MTTSLLILEQTSKIDGLEGHIEDLLRQKDLLEDIEYYTNNAIDFGDVLETYSLLVEEIERLQKELSGKKVLKLPEEERCKGEERASSLFKISRWSLKYYMRV